MAINFQSGIFNLLPHANNEKAHWQCQFLFSTTQDLILPKFCLKDHTHFMYFANFQWNMLGYSININNLCCNLVVMKKLVKSLKIAILFWGPTCAKGSAWVMPKEKNYIFGILLKAKADYQPSETYFVKIRFGWVMNLFLFCVIFLTKKESFLAKIAVHTCFTLYFQFWRYFI